MIQQSLANEGIENYRIVLVPDIHDYPHWVDHVLSIVDDFDVVITNNELTQELFEAKGINVINTPPFHKEKWSGSKIRQLMINNQPWESLVPPAVVKVIQSIIGTQRLRHLQ